MLPSSGQGSASVCTPKAPCSDVCNRAYIYCTRSPLLRFTGSIASTRTFTATATLSTLTPRQLYAPIQPRRCTATGGTPYQSGTSRSFVRNPRRTNNQEAVIHLEEAGCRTSPTSRPLKGTASSRVADRVANSHQQPHNRSSYGQSNNTRTSGRPQNQQQQYRHKAQVITIKQLTSYLKYSKTPMQLLQLVKQYGHQFDHIHIAAAFTHLGQWQSKDHITAADQQAVQELLQQLEQLLSPQQLQHCECRQLSNIIWACCLLRYTGTPLIPTCLTELTGKVDSARSLQDVSNVLYGLAESGLQVSENQMQQLIAAAGVQPLLYTSKPQNTVNAIWAVAKMEHKLPEQQLQRMVAALLSNSPQLIPQDVSNTVWSLAKMEAAVPLLQLQKLEAALVAKVARAKPSEVSNTLWACAELLYFPEQLLSALQQQQLWDVLLPCMKLQELANTALALGALGHRDEQLVGRILQEALQLTRQQQQGQNSSNPDDVHLNMQEVCNLCWAVAVLDLRQFAAEVVTLQGTCNRQWGSLNVEELSQIQQVCLWLQDMQQSEQATEYHSVLTKQQLQQCSTAWAAHVQQRAVQQSSAFQDYVFELLQQLPISWQVSPALEQLSQPDGMFSMDIGAVTADGLRLAIEVDGPTHFRLPDRGLTGSTLYRNRALSARGYAVVSVAAHDWEQLQGPQQQVQYLMQLLQSFVPELQQHDQRYMQWAATWQQRGRQASVKAAVEQGTRHRVQSTAARLQEQSQEPTQPVQQQHAASASGGRVRRIRRRVM